MDWSGSIGGSKSLMGVRAKAVDSGFANFYFFFRSICIVLNEISQNKIRFHFSHDELEIGPISLAACSSRSYTLNGNSNE